MKRILLLFAFTPLFTISQYNAEYSVTVKRLKANADNCDGGAPFCLNAPQDPVFNVWVTDGGGNENTYCWIFEDDDDAGYGMWKDIQNLEIAYEYGVNTSTISIDMSGFESDNLNPGCSPGLFGDDEIYDRQLAQTFDLTLIPQGTIYSTEVNIGGVYYADIDIEWTDLNASIDENYLAKHVSISPNPSTGVFNLAINEFESSSFDVNVMDITGRVIMTRTVNGSTISFDLSSELDGIYFVKISAGNQNVTRRIVKR